MPEKVHIFQISHHNLSVVIPLASQITLYSGIANDLPNTLPIIQLGRISEKLYLLSNLDVFYGIKKFGLDIVDAEIIDFVNESEFLIEHVKLNKSQPGYNSLLLYGIVEYLSGNGTSYNTSLKLLHINNTIEHKLLELKLNSDTIGELCLFYSYLAEKLSSCIIPYYVSEIVSKYDGTEQLKIIKKIIKFIKIEKISDSKFTWPSINSINILLSKSKNTLSSNDSAVIYEENDIPSEKEYVFAEKIIKQSKHVLIIPKTKKHSAYMINKKTNSVSIMTVKDTVITLVEMPTIPLYTLPKKAVNHLKLNESLEVTMKCFENNDEIIKYLKKHPDSKNVIFSK